MKKLTLLLMIFCCTTFLANSQTKKITGKVVSSEGQVLVGVSVIDISTQNGTTTDANGNYSILTTPLSDKLYFTYLGLNSQTRTISNQSVINVTLEGDTIKLDDVVVVGYGTQKKRDVTGSVASIKIEEINKIATTSFDQAIQGRMAGVFVSTNSGQPGASASIKIRGIGGTGNSEPLYVIDGVIISNNNSDGNNVNGSTQATNALASIAQNDIATIDILKDASATAIYGSRGANGVVIITTKRGKAGKPVLNFDAYYGFQTVAKKLDLLNASEYAAFSNDARIASEAATYVGFANPASLGEGTDYQKAIFRDAAMTNYQLSISGGSDKGNYFVSGGYLSQDGIVINSNFNRYSLRVNTDNQIGERLKIGNSLTISRSLSNTVANDSQDQGTISMALRRSPSLPIYAANGIDYAGPGSLNDETSYVGQIGNPVEQALINKYSSERMRTLGNVYAELKLVKGLSYRSNVGFDYINTMNHTFTPSYTDYPVDPLSLPVITNATRTAKEGKVTTQNVIWDNTLNYSNTFATKHKLDLLVGYSSQMQKTDVLSASSQGQIDNTFQTVAAGTTKITGNGYLNILTFASMLGRINYAYNERYLFTANIRRDGSSVFGDNNKYGVFPSFSVAWRVTEEEFMKKFTFINSLKLRGSYGKTGNTSNLGSGVQYATLYGWDYVLNGTIANGKALNSIPNRDLKWEVATQTDLGVDFTILDSKLNITADYFIKEFTDLITPLSIVQLIGIMNNYPPNPITQTANGATVTNSGIEFSADYRNNAGKLNYTAGFNITTFNNKVNELQGDILNTGTHTITRQGETLGAFYGYQTDGILQYTSPLQPNSSGGDIRFKDVSGPDGIPDGKIDEKDQTIIGSPIPKFVYGFNGTLSYGNFDFNLLLQGSYGNQILNLNRITLEGSNDGANKSTEVLGRWSINNPESTIPRAVAGDPNGNSRVSDRFVEDGSYLRVKTIQFGYRLQQQLVKKAGVSSLRLYLSAQNMFTLTKYKGYNPDVSANGVDVSVYPPARTLMIGVNVGF